MPHGIRLSLFVQSVINVHTACKYLHNIPASCFHRNPMLHCLLPIFLHSMAFSRPFCTRHLLIGLALPSKFTYCIQSVIPVPYHFLHYRRGKVVHQCSSHMFKKSCVPKLLSSVTPPHHRFTIAGLFIFWPDTIFPMVGICKTSTGPAKIGHF